MARKLIEEVARVVKAVKALDIKHMDTYTNATRPGAGTVAVGYTFFNTDDNFLNTSDGTNWRDPTGAVT